MLIFKGHFLRALHCAKFFTHVIIGNPHNIPFCIISLTFKDEERDREKSGALPKPIKLGFASTAHLTRVGPTHTGWAEAGPEAILAL